MRRNILLILVLLLPLVVSGAGIEIDGICYNLNEQDGTAEVTQGGNYSGNLIIPGTVTYEGVSYSVTSIGNQAFYNCVDLTSVTIPNTVTSIKHNVFLDCSSLTSLTLPNSVTSIGNYAFSGCQSLTSVTIPESLTSIGQYAFARCSALTSITIPSGVTCIESGAFWGCSGITSVTIPCSVTIIKHLAFCCCSGLTSITIPEGVTSIEEGVFSGCSGLTFMKVESGNTKYDSRDNCNAIIETATNTLIAGCQNTIIPSSLTSIGEEAFHGCTGLTSVDIPISVTSIGDWAFAECSGLTSIDIPNSVTSIGDCVFCDCFCLTSVTISNSVTSIKVRTFDGCSSLPSITIPASVTGIDSYAFRDCPRLTLVTVLNPVPVAIENDVFTNCANATLYVPVGSRDAYLAANYWADFKEIKEINTFESCPDDNHPHMIDLGLPSGTKWACCNVGATTPEGYGGYYAWGETEEKDNYDYSTYIHCDGSPDNLHDLGSDIAGTIYDVAHMKWGGFWQMPTVDQGNELIDNCTYEWTTINGINGGLLKGKNGGCIFLPAAGGHYFSNLNGLGDNVDYWMSLPSSEKDFQAYAVLVYSLVARMTFSNRPFGFPVRPIATEISIAHLQLSESSVEIIKGEGTTINITSGNGNYTVSSSNENVATATISGSSVTITAVSAGTATITVTDTQSGETATIEVTVTAPSVSLCPDNNHPHMIDLGLPSGTKWACCNVDTEHPENQSPTNYGGFYAWGETEVSGFYDWSTYSLCDGSSGNCQDIGSDIAGTVYDVAHAKWGGSWVMPSYEQFLELLDHSTYEWTTLNGVSGQKITATNGSSIFLPAAGQNSWGFPNEVGDDGIYWLSTHDPSHSYKAHSIYFYSGSIEREVYSERPCGLSIRPVAIESSVTPLQLSESSVAITVGENTTINITSGNGSYTVASSNENVATATISGSSVTITAVSAGSATITVTDTQSDETATIEVTVDNPPTPFSLSEESLTLTIGEIAIVYPNNGNGSYTCESSDNRVVTIIYTAEEYPGGPLSLDYFFRITAVSEGTAIITVTDTQSGETATIEVTVTPVAPPMPTSPSPSEDADNVATRGTFSWTTIPDDEESTLRYELFLDTDSSSVYSNSEVYMVGQGNTCRFSGLEPNTKYYWKVIVFNESGGHTTSDIWSFTTRETAPSSSSIRGDVNGDRNVTVADVMLMVNYVLQKSINHFLVKNADVNDDGKVTVTDIMKTIKIIMSGQGFNKIELPEGANINVSNLTVLNDGEQVTVDNAGTFSTADGDMMAFNGDSLVYISYGSQDDCRTLNSQETAISLLLPLIPYAVTDMDDDSFWLLKQMIGHLEQTRELAAAIDQSIIDKGYLDMAAVNPQYVAAAAEVHRRLGFDDSEPAHSRMRKVKKTSYPIFVYGNKEAYGDGFTLVKDHTLWGTGDKGDCWKCKFTIFNAERWCYTSLTKAVRYGDGFNRLDDSFSDTFTNLIKPMNVSAFMDWGTLSDIATNPKDFLKSLSEFDFDRVISMFWDPLKNLGHILKGEETETSSFDKIKKSGIEFDIYPDTEHLMVAGPGIDQNLMLFNFVKIAFQPVMKMMMKEVVKSDAYDKSDLMDQIFVQFVKYISEMDVTFRAKQIAILGNSSLSWWERISTVWDNISDKMAMFFVKDVIIDYFSEAIYEDVLEDLAKGYNDPQIKAIFTTYKAILAAGDILMFMLDSQYKGVAFEMDHGPSYESYHERQYENFTVGDVTFTMMKLPGGPFMMGAEPDDKRADGSEKPLHYVNLKKFAIGEAEVTQSLWQAVMGSNPSKFVNGNRPVDNVSWLDCQEFITKLNQLTGRTFRLPTEAEWEFAACGGMYKRGYPYAGGENVDEVAWYKDKDNSINETHPVRLKKANEFGLYDMSGNVMEWCQDYYDANYYGHSPEENPRNDVTATLYARVLRGGNWYWDDKYCRVSSRTSIGQGVRSEIYGLRLAMDDQTLQLSTNTLNLTTGGQGTVDIITGSGSYTIDNNTPSVAFAVMKNNTIVITGISANEAVVTVSDTKTGYRAEIHVNVTAAQTETISVNGVSLKMVGVEGGTFKMGAAEDDSDASEDERPLHQVKISTFSIGETEVTQALWNAVMGSNPSTFQGDNNPVDNVSWLDCQEFITKLNQLTGRTFRLPTEAEWEYAARGGACNNGYKYSGSNDVKHVAWYKENGENQTHPVGQMQANAIGLHDMSGNVMEWCQDFYDANYYGHSPEENPCNDATASLYARVLRGGSWHWDDKYCRVSSRNNNAQGVKAEQFGLRLAMDVSDTPQAYLTCPDDHHPHMIDLGLPSGTKWACCNVGADTPEAYGGYYAWGETDEKDYYGWNTYIHCDGSEETCHDLGSDIAGTQYDVAHVKWGGSWMMPSFDQQTELRKNCSSEWTTVNGVNGMIFTGSNGGSIFLPAAGRRIDSDLRNAGSYGYYWSSTQNPSYVDRAYGVDFNSDGTSASLYYRPYRGQSVRPVSR